MLLALKYVHILTLHVWEPHSNFQPSRLPHPNSIGWRRRYTHAGHVTGFTRIAQSLALTDEDMCFLGVETFVNALEYGVVVLYFNCEIKTNTVHISVQKCTHSDMCMNANYMHAHTLTCTHFSIPAEKQVVGLWEWVEGWWAWYAPYKYIQHICTHLFALIWIHIQLSYTLSSTHNSYILMCTQSLFFHTPIPFAQSLVDATYMFVRRKIIMFQ